MKEKEKLKEAFEAGYALCAQIDGQFAQPFEEWHEAKSRTPLSEKDLYYKPLFDLMYKNYWLSLEQKEMDEIIKVVQKLNEMK